MVSPNIIVFYCLALIATTPALASDVGVAFFESKIRPALVAHCYECHSEAEGNKKGGLWLDRKAGWEVGGDSGPAVIPGDVEGSLLIETIRYEDPDLEMPPKSKLPNSVVADFEKWIAMGTPDPRERGMGGEDGGMTVEEGREFWSFRPRQTDFGKRDSIDDFINARLETEGLEASPAASPQRRLRRARVDLTGFIPTVEEQLHFELDPSEENWKAVVDQGLASDAFGERWGRHWLDIVRYADSSGGGRALPFPDAWRFRDYVIGAFATDRPLDELIKAHIAGDLLPYETQKERSENLIATGFLVMGPNNYENQNKAELDFEIIDEQVDTIGRAFMGQTIACSRCHDHKFDPIPTKDYYALAGIFLSTRSVKHSNVSAWHLEPIPPTKEAKRAIEDYEKEKAAADAEVVTFKTELASLGRGAGKKSKKVAATLLPGIVIDDEEAVKVGEWKASSSAPRFIDAGYVHDLNAGQGEKSVRYEHVFETAGRYELRVSYSASSNRSPIVQVMVNVGSVAEGYQINQKLTPEYDDLFQAIGVFAIEAGDESSIEITNLHDDGVAIADAIQWLPLELVQNQESRGGTTDDPRILELEKALAKAEAKLKKLERNAPTIPQAMSVVDHPTDKIGDTEIRIRGVEASRGEVAPRGFLEVARLDEVDISESSSGRLELAEWLTSDQHPLTSRVLANRIWLKLMGEGLVTSPDNFGTTGIAPTHPELLDYLAGRLIESGWSTKALVREIMLSDVYSRSTKVTTKSVETKDPENSFYSRAHLRSLDAESLRDAMLTLSGTLDGNAGGPSLPKGFKSEFGYEFTTMKRSVYVPVFRNSSYEMFSVFDFANPNFTVGKRNESNIPTQMLFLTNSQFVHDRSIEAASELLRLGAETREEGIELAFRRTLGRPPSSEELDLARGFISDTQAGDAQAWAGLQRILFGSVDFRYLR